MTVRVRPATPADYPEIARLTVDAYTADGQLTTEAAYAPVLADVAGRADAGELLVAVDGQRVLGAVLFVHPGGHYAEVSGPGEGEFRMLAVDPAAQGRGAGRALVRACVERAVAVGCHAIVISVRDFARAAQRLYDGAGFTRLPERDWSPAPQVRLLALRLELPNPA
jgi:ribosomal protein S18 acetylase RimI-like enzyme